ncbi:hypothetical protein A8C32_05120 [Flavivirga aquatica]|uniref:Uncharacterized protein n=1 Tax=Flavivirga aquatica TaxID=1849968 RepID=A0A1E5SHJ7_9FLAO|nr:hypothetical protein [Flavivirga aquatica]OEJ98584.1 hypothetical protein A8C32_05120 [Flavivirga aquatica]
MKNIIPFLSKILDNSYVNLIVSIGLIVIGIEELYKADVMHLEIHWKHGISFYGILMCIQAAFKIAKGGVKVYKNELVKRSK